MTQHLYYFATCPKGVEDLLLQECKQLGLKNVDAAQGGVYFEGNLEDAYRMCLWSRLASRVLLKLTDFQVDNYDELYSCVQTIDWSTHLNADSSLAIDCFTAHEELNNSHYATLRIKDAIVDQFKVATGERPSIDRERPDIRINVYIGKKESMLYLDLSGEPLHKRGYRLQTGAAPLKENLAAAILLRCKWPELARQIRPLFDPMCGAGTLLIEAAYIAANRAPGILRDYYGFMGWKQHQEDVWQSVYKQANQDETDLDDLPEISGAELSQKALAIARETIGLAGLDSHIKLYQMDSTKSAPALAATGGLVVTNPPYGKRLGEEQQLMDLYYRFGRVLKQKFGGWEVAVFSANQELVRNIGLRSHHKNTLYNGALKCNLYHYRIREIEHEGAAESNQSEQDKTWHDNATMFANRLAKNIKHISKWAGKNNITCYRIYDADIPQYSVAIDLYQDWVHIQEYEAPKAVNTAKAIYRLKDIVEIVCSIMSIEKNSIVIKTRRKQSGTQQYSRLDQKNEQIIVSENQLRFIINLHDYLDTGLFLDQRLTRKIIYNHVSDITFLNLFAYTGVATVYAAAGGAISTTTVDMSNTYLEWAKDNMKLNGFKGDNHKYIRTDCLQWIKEAEKTGKKYQFIFLDPPTFSNSKKMKKTLDIQRDHVWLISNVMRLLAKDGLLIFSCNARKFSLDEEKLRDFAIKNITELTTPEDFRRRPAHKCWCLGNQTPIEHLRIN